MDPHWSHFHAHDSDSFDNNSYRFASLYPDEVGDSMALFGGRPSEQSSTMNAESANEEESQAPTEARRNLMEEFEEMYVEPPSSDASSPSNKETDVTKGAKKESPTGVADLVVEEHAAEPQDKTKDPDSTQENTLPSAALSFDEQDDDDTVTDDIPNFELHESLQRDLSQPLVNRVSLYGVIHDINKEANSMASNDTSSFARSSCEEPDEEFSPLVVAVNGAPSREMPASTMMESAAIDEEKWLLAAIDLRGEDESRSVSACPPTFLQAMGEREYENPLASMASSRTQLWKPSRSWWEAKSGKNPWIEPTSHNKRWRYLWPLIHYHKFLAKCIKKLKRNGVDVKTTVSPVAVFLREEVCAVSDHLAAVSLFTSEEWMQCLVHFNGWTDHSEQAEARLRKLISKLSLRPLAEPGDVDSPLLRSQVDEHFLRAMASAREQMTNGGAQQERVNLSKSAAHQAGNDKAARKNAQHGRNKIPLHPQTFHGSAGHPPYLARHPSGTHPMSSHSPGASKGEGSSGQPSWGYPGGHGWWGNGWPQYAYCDESSVQSDLSTPSYFHQYGEYHGMYPGAPHGAYYPNPQDRSEYFAYGQQYPPPLPEQYQADPAMPAGWMGHDPNYAPQNAEGYQGPPPGTPGTPHRNYNPYHASPTDKDMVRPDQTPHRTPYGSGVPLSPYWGHLDQATLAMTGLMTPHGKVPETPLRGQNARTVSPDEEAKDTDDDDDADTSEDTGKAGEEFAVNAKPLLFSNPSGYYHHGPYGAREGYVPPSPATQFMMSPQASSQAAAYYAHNYGNAGYSFSPRRHGWRQPRVRPPSATKEKQTDANKEQPVGEVTPPPTVRKVTVTNRESPCTVETMAESESIAPPDPSIAAP